MVVFIKLKDNRDIIALKTFGLNINFLILFSISSIFISIVILFVLNPLTSATVKYYEDIKNMIWINLILHLLILMVFG